MKQINKNPATLAISSKSSKKSKVGRAGDDDDVSEEIFEGLMCFHHEPGKVTRCWCSFDTHNSLNGLGEIDAILFTVNVIEPHHQINRI